MHTIFRKFWPGLIILFVWLIFSSPYFFKGKIPYSSTYQVNNFAPWDAYPQFHGPVKNGAMPDITTQIYPWKYLVISLYKNGQLPLWNPYSFSGTPLLANYQSAVLSPFNLLFFLFSFRDGWSLLILLQSLLAGIFMLMYLRSLMISKWGCLFGSIAFMFCGFITVWMDYGTLGYAILYLPLSLYAIESYYSLSQIRYLFLLTLTIPLSFFSGHFQISIYFIVSVLIYETYKALSMRNRRNLFLVYLFTFYGLCCTLPQVLPSFEFYQQSLRSNFYVKSEVIPWEYFPTMIAPDFFGNPVTRNDWFGHYAEWNMYIGLSSLIFAWYALKKRKWFIYFLFFMGIGTLLLAFPTPLLDGIEFLRIPVLATSAASRVVILYSFFFIILSSFGFDAFISDIKKKNIKFLSFIIAIIIGIFCLLWVLLITKHMLPLNKISIAKQNLILPTIQIVILLGLTIIGILFRKHKAFLLIFPILIVSLLTFDMLRFSIKWQPFDPKGLAFMDTPVGTFLSTISGSDRAIGNYGAEVSNYYRLSSLEGYDALYNQRYGQFITTLNSGKLSEAGHSVVIFPKNSIYTPKVINLLGVSYIIHKVSDDYTSWTFPFWNYPGSQFQKLYDDGSYRVYKNTLAFPRAFLVSNYFIKTNPQDIFTTMFSKNINLRKSIILEKNPGMVSSSNMISGDVTLSAYTANKIRITTSANKTGLLLLSDPYYPGWNAYVDGKQVEILRADFAFRAIVVPSGVHSIEFVYQPMSFFIGVILSLFFLVCMFFTILVIKITNYTKKE